MPSQLDQGDLRFTVLFENPDLRIPVARTLVFIERRTSDAGTPLLIFRCVHPDADTERSFVRESDAAAMLLDPDALLHKLRRAFERTAGAPPDSL